MNFLVIAIEHTLPFIIALLEIMGIFIITSASVVAFVKYFRNALLHNKKSVQANLAKGLLVGLEFEMAGEILKTILIQTLDEIYILGGIIVIRIALSLLIHFENRHHDTKSPQKNEPHPSENKEAQV